MEQTKDVNLEFVSFPFSSEDESIIELVWFVELLKLKSIKWHKYEQDNSL